MARAALDRLIEPSLPAAAEASQRRPAMGDLDDEPSLREWPEREQCRGCRDRRGHEAEQCRLTEAPGDETKGLKPDRGSECEPRQKQQLNRQKVDAEPPGRAENSPLRPAREIIEDPAQGTPDLARQRSAHVGADVAFQTEKIVTRRDLPVRRPHLDRPVREVIGSDLDRLEREADRPHLAEALARALEQLVIDLCAAWIVALDI